MPVTRKKSNCQYCGAAYDTRAGINGCTNSARNKILRECWISREYCLERGPPRLGGVELEYDHITQSFVLMSYFTIGYTVPKKIIKNMSYGFYGGYVDNEALI